MTDTTYTHTTREAWLGAFASHPATVARFAAAGGVIPDNVRYSVSSPDVHGKAKHTVLGMCWHPDASQDGHYEIFVVATSHNATDAQVAAVLTHELCHAATGNNGHGRDFGKLARATGLEGPLTSTVAGSDWMAWALEVLKDIGPMPYAAIDFSKPPKKKRNPYAPIGHTCEVCGAQAWITPKWKAALDYISCIAPECDGVMFPKDADATEIHGTDA